MKSNMVIHDHDDGFRRDKDTTTRNNVDFEIIMHEGLVVSWPKPSDHQEDDQRAGV